jgi:hypothetical protein
MILWWRYVVNSGEYTSTFWLWLIPPLLLY